MKSIPEPKHWSRRFFYVVAGTLATLNLLGPHGFMHWVLLKQESSRLELKAQALQSEVDAVKSETRRFESSGIARERAVREELGFLKPDEISVELGR